MMRVIKYPQSCLVLDKAGHRIAIDPGSFFRASYGRSELGKVEAVLYTHQHADHCDPELAKALAKEKVALYGNESVCELIGGGCVLADGAGFTVAGFEVRPYDLPHCEMPDGSAGPPNTGYIIDGHFFHPGDGIDTDGLKIDHLALPIAGSSISLRSAYQFAVKLGAKKIIPMHYDNTDLFPGNPEGFRQVYSRAEVIVLADGESVEL